LFAATTGDVTTTDRALELAMAEGAAPVQVLRAGIIHLQRLQRARMVMDEIGRTAADASRSLRPPIFYRRVTAFNTALGLWSGNAVAAAINGLMEAERECKRTGRPDHTLCRNAILVLARRTAALRSART
jgi:DNA polymerase-3 subunit delta